MDKRNFLPIGTVVVMKGEAQRKVMVITRALATKFNDEMVFFDYGGCFYPIGLLGDQILYFNQQDIAEVVHMGYSDEYEAKQQEQINKWLIEHDMKQGSVQEVMALKKKEFEAASERAKNMQDPREMLNRINGNQQNTNNDAK